MVVATGGAEKAAATARRFLLVVQSREQFVWTKPWSMQEVLAKRDLLEAWPSLGRWVSEARAGDVAYVTPAGTAIVVCVAADVVVAGADDRSAFPGPDRTQRPPEPFPAAAAPMASCRPPVRPSEGSQEKKNQGLATASFVLGCVSLVLYAVPLVPLTGLGLGIASLCTWDERKFKNGWAMLLGLLLSGVYAVYAFRKPLGLE